jgi:hypothetical protein
MVVLEYSLDIRADEKETLQKMGEGRKNDGDS